MESILQTLAIAAAVIGATWTLRSKLGDIESALREHVASDATAFAALSNRVIKLEGRTRRR